MNLRRIQAILDKLSYRPIDGTHRIREARQVFMPPKELGGT